ncbi:MAG: hypothetical protein QM497_08540 [Sulfurimonas sp.]
MKIKKSVYNLLMNLKELQNKTILLLGKSRAFSIDEFMSQMKHHKISVINELNDEVVLSVDGRMMTPYEQNTSDALYESQKFSSISIDALEKELAKEIDKDTLLMSLKLSHDKERLKSFIQNTMISHELFFKLMKMYKWNGEDFFENDDNRDVSAAFISRFYENIERNHNVQYATTGFIHLVAQAKNVEILNAISLLEPLIFHPKIKRAIAMSVVCDEAMQKRFFKSQDPQFLEALSVNKNLNLNLLNELITNEYFGDNIARNIELNEKLFEKLEKFSVALAGNESLTLEMQEKLLNHNDGFINVALASNSYLSEKNIEKLLLLDEEDIKQALYENSATSQELLQKAYENAEYHGALARNENTPIDILYQLQLDSRYDRMVKTNAGFGKHIQSENIGWMV